jgi:hypothetical protein
VDGEKEAFHKIKGHIMVENKDDGNFEIMFTESNIGDEGAR